MVDPVPMAAARVLRWAVLLLIPSVAMGFRLLALPRSYGRVAETRRRAGLRSGMVIVPVATAVMMLFFLLLVKRDLWLVMRARLAWGMLAAWVGAWLMALVVVVERLHLHNEQYVDLASGLDEERMRKSKKHYAEMVRFFRAGCVVWMGALGVATFWLWRIAQGE